ncbi:MAG: pentapeptide repeat-containing protein [Chitinophagaceae bacterium]|nr:pentapeptide repeat-containing protein [Oligoflexus sp.]
MTFDEAKEFCEEHFQGTEIRDKIVTDKEFQDCTFSNIQFNQAGFLRCRFLDCQFENCDLSNLTVKNCTFRDTEFKASKIIGINWTETSGFHGVKFLDSVLSFSICSGMDLRRLVIENCHAHEMDFAHANLSEAKMRRSDFKGSQFSATNLTKADFREALNYRIHPIENTLKQTKFSLPEATSLLYQLDIILE